eukprot:1009031-Pyramimonas_sp.AAC.1
MVRKSPEGALQTDTKSIILGVRLGFEARLWISVLSGTPFTAIVTGSWDVSAASGHDVPDQADKPRPD